MIRKLGLQSCMSSTSDVPLAGKQAPNPFGLRKLTNKYLRSYLVTQLPNDNVP